MGERLALVSGAAPSLPASGREKRSTILRQSALAEHINRTLLDGQVGCARRGFEAKRHGYHEGIALGYNGLLSEGAGENLFIIRKGKKVTLPASTLPASTLTDFSQLPASTIVRSGRTVTGPAVTVTQTITTTQTGPTQTVTSVSTSTETLPPVTVTVTITTT